jgi:hypothetical protein
MPGLFEIIHISFFLHFLINSEFNFPSNLNQGENIIEFSGENTQTL